MNVFANYCDPVSFVEGFKNAGDSFLISDLVMFEGDGNIVPGMLKYKFPNNPIKANITGNYVFSKVFISLIYAHNSWAFTKDPRRIIEFYNSDGLLIASIGWNTSALNYGSDTLPVAIFSWTAAGAVKTVLVDTTSGQRPLSNYSDYSIRYPDRALAFEYSVDSTTPANSFFKLYYGSDLLLQMSGAQLTDAVNNVVSKIVFFDASWTANTMNGPRYNIAYIVATDSKDLGIEPVILRPTSLVSATDWIGTISAIQEKLQDATYLSCAAETGKYIDIKLGVATPGWPAMKDASSAEIASAAMHFYGRYVQVGGTSATFTVTFFDANSILLATTDVVVPANEDNLYYQTKIISDLTGLLSQVGSKITGGTVRIALKEL